MTDAAEKHESVYPIAPQDVMRIWSSVAPILQRAVKRISGCTIDTVLTDLQLGHAQLWVIGDYRGVAVTTLQTRPLERVVWINYLAGNELSEWMPEWIEALELYAQSVGADVIEFNGRKGWNKLHKYYREYKPVWTTFRRELSDGRQ